MVWTNIAKIGVGTGNPSRRYLELQRELAIETIKFEIRDYKPRIVFWVTGEYATDVVNEVIGDPTETSWEKGLCKIGCYWRPARGQTPAMIWTYHPQGQKRDVLMAWLDKARELAAQERGGQ